MTVVPPEQRVDPVCFDPKAESTDHVVHVGAYGCPRCGAEVEFNTVHLRRAAEWSRSPPGDDWDRDCRVARPLLAWGWGLDFGCPGCSSPVRLVYGHDGEFQMGSCKYRVLAVIEP